MKRSQAERLRAAGFVQGKSNEVIWLNTLNHNWETVKRSNINYTPSFIELIDAPSTDEMMTWLMPEITDIHPEHHHGKFIWVVHFLDCDIENPNITEVLVQAIEKVLKEKQK